MNTASNNIQAEIFRIKKPKWMLYQKLIVIGGLTKAANTKSTTKDYIFDTLGLLWL